MECNLCGSPEFRDVGKRSNVLCVRCGSYERTRLMQLYLARHGLRRNMRILHLAPETGLARWLMPQVDAYVAADFDPPRYKHIPDVQFVDLTEPESYERFGTFDLIIHNHVLEHIPYNYSALLLRLHRMLRPDGVQAFSVPVYGGFYTEHWGPMSDEEATQRFGQFDHIRRFSPKDLSRTIGALFTLDEPDLAASFGAETLRAANIPETEWLGWNGSSIFWCPVAACKFPVHV